MEKNLNEEAKERLEVGKVLIFGASGMAGSRFLEIYAGNFITPSNTELDITDAIKVKELIDREKPDFIINLAAYTNVSDAERQKGKKDEICWKVNVEGVRNILDAIEPEKTQFIQISTDMVFSGSEDNPGPYNESHIAETDQDKLTWYGYTKAEAERLILKKLRSKATILRIIYPVRKNYEKKLDYLRKPLEQYKEGKLLPLFTDQQISITSIDEVCQTLARIVKGKHIGIFHAGSKDTTTPYKIISYYLESYYLEKVLEKNPLITSREMGDLTKRYPQWGGLQVKSTEERLGMQFSTCREIVDQLILN